MNTLAWQPNFRDLFRRKLWAALFCIALLPLSAQAIAQQVTDGQTPLTPVEASSVTPAPQQPANLNPPLIIEGTNANDVFGIGRSVEVRGNVQKGVISFGGDVVVSGRVEGDVAAIGGNVRQRTRGYIGGEVMVLGGAYYHDATPPERGAQAATIVFAGYEQELRELMLNPTSILRPRITSFYIGQRLLGVLFWFIASLLVTAVTPGAVSRAVVRLHLTSLRVAIIGFVAALVFSFGTLLCLNLLPTGIGALVGLMIFLLLLAAYFFGRIALHAATGQWLQRRFLANTSRSETVALLLGSLFWAVMLSLPYIWLLILGGLIVVSLGLALTARYRLTWRREAQAS